MDRAHDRRRTDTRERLIRAATGSFRRHGVGGVGVGAVCERAGVTKGVFSHHFPGGKSELVEAVIAANRRTVLDRLGAATAPPRRGPAVVQAMFDGYAGAMRSGGSDFGCPVAASVVDTSGTSSAARRAADEAFRSWAAALADHLGPNLAELAVATMEGAVLVARAADDPGVVERIGRTLADLVESSPSLLPPSET